VHPDLEVSARVVIPTGPNAVPVAGPGGGDFVVTATAAELRKLISSGIATSIEVAPELREATVTSEGMSTGRAPDWHLEGWTGKGVEIAVFDSSFTGYTTLLGTELPATVHTASFHASGLELGTNRHGTAVAEIVHDIAPDADLHLVNADAFSLDDAVDYFIAEGIDIVNLSGGWTVGPFDGRALQDGEVNRAIDAGIIWVNAAGNEADQHFAREFVDADGDLWAEVEGTVEINDFFVSAGEAFSLVLNWGDGRVDLDLCLWDLEPAVGSIRQLECSETIQNETGDQPVETIDWINVTGDRHWYGFSVGGTCDGGVPLVPCLPGASPLGEDYNVFLNPVEDLGTYTPAGSLLVPNAVERVISVGAAPWYDPTNIQFYSSRGPTADGRIKPDLIAPDQVSTSTFGPSGFLGTSSSSPYVAGLIALYLQAHPGTTPAAMRRELAILAEAIPPSSGKNNTGGWGRARIGDLPPVHDWVAFQDPRGGRWTLLKPDGTTEEFFYGLPSDNPMACDWDGDGTDTPGLYRTSNGFMYLRNSNDFGIADVSFFFGLRSDRAICGDWDGDGVDTIGVYRPSESKFYLRNSNDLGFSDIEFVFGNKGDEPFAGDWDGDGIDTVGLYRPTNGFVYISNTNATRFADSESFYGVPGDRFLVGDWDGDGRDSFGIFRPTDPAFYLSNTVGDGIATQVIDFGNLFGIPVAGDFGFS
jgi:subtilisin family serine protease